jgi:hypothetical protein
MLNDLIVPLHLKQDLTLVLKLLMSHVEMVGNFNYSGVDFLNRVFVHVNLSEGKVGKVNLHVIQSLFDVGVELIVLA